MLMRHWSCIRAMAAGVVLGWFALSPLAHGSDISVMVVDRDGRGVSQVVVIATPSVTAGIRPLNPLPAVMDQRNRAFLPTVLVVGIGTRVEFPNNDSVSHQVYSFSPAKRFQLPLYKGQPHSPVTFDRPGLVVLGCNIHDAMVGYIYVTEAPFFGTTAAGGTLQWTALPAGEYRITIWSPFIADAPESLERTVRLDGHESVTMHVQLHLALRAQPEPRPRHRDWEY